MSRDVESPDASGEVSDWRGLSEKLLTALLQLTFCQKSFSFYLKIHECILSNTFVCLFVFMSFLDYRGDFLLSRRVTLLLVS